MAVISISITESPIQKVEGIPIAISVETNIPATVFFTLDGSDPDTSSSIIIDSLSLPTNQNSIVLKLFATDGVNNSPIITKEYGPTTEGLRRPRDEISGLDAHKPKASFPYGSFNQGGPAIYGNTAGITVDDPEIEGIPGGFDGAGGVSHETDLPLEEYQFKFSETNWIGERSAGLGTLPGGVKLFVPPPIHEDSVPSEGTNDANKPLFNPRSLVIFQDGSEEPFDPAVGHINRAFFSLEDPERARDGSAYHLTAFEGNIPHGSALRQQYNPKNNTITYYYYDNRNARWIISKEPFTPTNPDVGNLSSISFGREKGIGKVFKWHTYQRRLIL